jgi:hypothetical protein
VPNPKSITVLPYINVVGSALIFIGVLVHGVIGLLVVLVGFIIVVGTFSRQVHFHREAKRGSCDAFVGA